MKVTRRSVLHLSGACAAVLALSGCTGAGHAGLGSSFTTWFRKLLGAEGSSSASESATDTPLPVYDADPLTGEARRSNGRLVGVMVNNICNSARQNARPQRGLSAADLLIESKVEGNITRFCAVYHDADAIPEVGPLRSGRDQFLQLLMPYQALYYHDGESAPCTKFISVYDYSGLNIGGKSYFDTPVHPHVAHRDDRGGVVAYEHTEFTSGKEIRTACANAGIGLESPCENTFFRFADYRTGAEVSLSDAKNSKEILVVHSANYQSRFTYDHTTHRYRMQQYSRITGGFEKAVDELNGQQLTFDNLLICFANIAAYPGDSGDVQQVQYIEGGEAYLFTRGKVQPAVWEKASPEHPLRVRDLSGVELVLNRGKTYLAIVDDDQRNDFSYN